MIHLDGYFDFVDELQFVYLKDSHIGARIESTGQEMAKRGYISDVFKLRSLSLGHIVPRLPVVSLGALENNAIGVDLLDVLEPLQSYLLSCSSEHNFFTSVEAFLYVLNY